MGAFLVASSVAVSVAAGLVIAKAVIVLMLHALPSIRPLPSGQADAGP